ncbi:MAG: hypothetical protein EBW98_03400, partial [Actinobacteria bacterium]|nr:hypothetical protein [Actinomycetota bacterium]
DANVGGETALAVAERLRGLGQSHQVLCLTHLPAFVFLRIDGNVVASAQGWNPVEWRAVADEVARTVSWSKPLIPAPGDPGAFTGTPALV